MPSKTLTDTQKLAEDIVTALDAHAAELDAAAAARLKPDLSSGERWPSLALLLSLGGRRVRRTLAAYAAAERALEAERADDTEPRAARDAYALSLSQQLKRVRATVDSLFGEATVRKLQLPAELPRDPARLALAADEVIAALATVKLPRPQMAGVGKVDASAWSAALAAPLALLKAARALVNREDKELATALAARDRAAAELNAAMVDALALARGAAALADRAGLFDGLRATVASSASTSDGDQPATPAEPDATGTPVPARPA